ncbi:hypothetical protein L484_007625 [Morus notabilis]|uniref:Uncharacterized protein n=1 Tax=Morus notabilis TaxID=981085 RepID=W9QI98_9ROSA|nr:hypothetical protein L484_007625 [Morus notabilis]
MLFHRSNNFNAPSLHCSSNSLFVALQQALVGSSEYQLPRATKSSKASELKSEKNKKKVEFSQLKERVLSFWSLEIENLSFVMVNCD